MISHQSQGGWDKWREEGWLHASVGCEVRCIVPTVASGAQGGVGVWWQREKAGVGMGGASGAAAIHTRMHSPAEGGVEGRARGA